MTANQNLIIAGVAAEDKAQIEAIARAHGLIEDSVTEQRQKFDGLCVAADLPTGRCAAKRSVICQL